MSIRFLAISGVVAVAAALGWYQLFAFSAKPGEQLAAPMQWPREPEMTLALDSVPGDRLAPLLMVFVHPGCSCTRATLQQLDAVLDSTHAAARVALVVYRSRAVTRETGAVAMHHAARVVPDRGGLLARRFGAATSGEIVLYSADGRLLFQGGITPMRSHTGPSAGAGALQLALTTGKAQTHSWSVFGCPIFATQRAG